MVTPEHGDGETVSPTSDVAEMHFSKHAATDVVSPATAADGDLMELNEAPAVFGNIYFLITVGLVNNRTGSMKSVVKVSRGPAPAPLNLASYGPGSCFVGPGSYFLSPGCCSLGPGALTTT